MLAATVISLSTIRTEHDANGGVDRIGHEATPLVNGAAINITQLVYIWLDSICWAPVPGVFVSSEAVYCDTVDKLQHSHN